MLRTIKKLGKLCAPVRPAYYAALARHKVSHLILRASVAIPVVDPEEQSRAFLQKITDRLPGFVYQLRRTQEGTYTLPFVSRSVQQVYQAASHVPFDFDTLMGIIHPSDVDNFLETLDYSYQHLSTWTVEYRIYSLSGEIHWLMCTASPEKEISGGVLWYGFITDITERKNMEVQIKELAFYDALTKLPNRYLLEDRLKQALTACRRLRVRGALLFIDLDNFKTLNDSEGHAAGDALLREASVRLKSCIRDTDTAARFGGDEFIVILTELESDIATARSSAEEVAEKIRRALSETYYITSHSISVKHQCTASVGICMFKNPNTEPDSVIRRADLAMYEAKAAGRNAIKFYEQTED